MFTKEMINSYADKLLIGLTEEETNTLLDEFSSIQENMELIDKIDGLNDVEPMHFPTDYEISTLRDGQTSRNIDRDEALSNSDDTMEGMNIVPKVVG